jgi:thiol-disulfide isomerase/thioredoxin
MHLTALVWILLISASGAAGGPDACAPTPAAHHALQDWASLPDTMTVDSRRKLLDQLAERFPRDYDIQARRLSFYRGAVPATWPRLRESYIKRARQNPGDPLALMLAASALHRGDTAQAIELLNRARAVPGGTPLASLHLAEIYQTGRFEDREKARRHFTEYAEVCGQYLTPSAVRVMSRLSDSQELAPLLAKRLRARLGSERSPEPADYELLWRLEFQSSPPPAHPALRDQVSKDLEPLLSRKLDKRVVNSLLAGMKQSAASKETIEAFENRIVRETPDSYAAYRILNDRWSAVNRQPADHESSEAWENWNRSHRQALRGWLAQFPHVIGLEQAYVRSVIESGELNNKQAIDLADQFLKRSVLRNTASIAMYAEIANMLMIKGAPGRAFAWMEKAWPRAEKKDIENLEEDTLTAAQREELAGRAGLRGLVAPEYLKAMALAGRKRMPASLRAYVGRPLPLNTTDRVNHYRSLAWLAAVDGNHADSLTLFQRAMVSRGREPQYFRGKVEDPLAAEVKRAFLKSGGTEESFAVWLQRSPHSLGTSDGQWLPPDATLPAFELTDVSGQRWTLAQLAGKVVLINVWATWCGPCRVELPKIQELHEATRGRSDLQVISFNVDEDLGRVAPYMKARGYSFPALAAYGFVSRTLFRYEIPQNWLIDPNGKWIATQRGFDGADPDWTNSILRRMEAAKRASMPRR